MNPTSNKKAKTFDARNPHKYLDRNTWNKLTDAQKEQARAARRKAGIPTREEKRNIGSLVSGDSTPAKDDDEVHIVEPPTPEPEANMARGIQTICIRRNISMTQRKNKRKRNGGGT